MSRDFPWTTIERDLATIYNLFNGAMAWWSPPEPGDKSVSDEAWSLENQAHQKLRNEATEVFHRYPNLLYVESISGRPAHPILADWETWTDAQRLEFLGALECCRGCGSLDTRCQCQNDE